MLKNEKKLNILLLLLRVKNKLTYFMEYAIVKVYYDT